ncbi:MAG: hypothetical protein U5Q16_05525 [Gammaproteobacteria bacterium]|nr:hypothetical protein [Gammaproteobacteria bacterium]
MLTLLAVLLPGVASAADGSAAGNPYGDRSDKELTALAANWDSLDKLQRRALLTEMKLRMARRGSNDGQGVIHIRTERRYGRIIRQADGRVIRIETQVVHVRPLDSENPSARQSFGVGFERRVARREEPPADDDGSSVKESGEARDGSGGWSGVLEPLEGGGSAPDIQVPLYRVSDPAP